MPLMHFIDIDCIGPTGGHIVDIAINQIAIINDMQLICLDESIAIFLVSAFIFKKIE